MDDLDGVVHIVGPDTIVNGRRRQRCLWCGALLVDDNLAAMGWPLDEDGTDPGPPAPWKVGTFMEVLGEIAQGDYSIRTTADDPGPDETGNTPLPDRCCAILDPEITR
jgi:hypothetical protein